LIPNPQQSIEVAAVSFFLEGNLVEPLSAGRCMGHLEFLPKLYLQASPSSALVHVTNATCLAALGNFGTERGPIMKNALEAYGQAVVSLHLAMKDAEIRTRNETLMAVILMTALESLLAWTKSPSQQWATHIVGAMWLLKLRGASVLDDPVASRIYAVVRHFVQQGSNDRGEPLDPFFTQSVAETVKVPDCPESRLSPITRSLFGLRNGRYELFSSRTKERY
jgi:hypothetical protein